MVFFRGDLLVNTLNSKLESRTAQPGSCLCKLKGLSRQKMCHIKCANIGDEKCFFPPIRLHCGVSPLQTDVPKQQMSWRLGDRKFNQKQGNFREDNSHIFFSND